MSFKSYTLMKGIETLAFFFSIYYAYRAEYGLAIYLISLITLIEVIHMKINLDQTRK